MNMNRLVKRIVFTALVICMMAGFSQPMTAAAKTVNILMIGNSLTMRRNNTTIKTLKEFAAIDGDSVHIRYVAHDGETLKTYANAKTRRGKEALRAIRSYDWDYVVLQDKTAVAAASGKTLVKSAKTLTSWINKYCKNATIIYNATWANNCTKKVGNKLYTKSTQQRNINRNYAAAVRATGGRVAWSGKAFAAYEKVKGHKALYLSDKVHGTAYGWYLNACCLYAAIFEKKPGGYDAGLNKTQTEKMRNIAARLCGVG